MEHVPDFPKGSQSTSARGGDLIPANAGPGGKTTGSRGRYPADGAGPPQTPVGSKGPSGAKDEITATTTQVTRPSPTPSPRANLSNPIK